MAHWWCLCLRKICQTRNFQVDEFPLDSGGGICWCSQLEEHGPDIWVEQKKSEWNAPGWAPCERKRWNHTLLACWVHEQMRWTLRMDEVRWREIQLQTNEASCHVRCCVYPLVYSYFLELFIELHPSFWIAGMQPWLVVGFYIVTQCQRKRHRWGDCFDKWCFTLSLLSHWIHLHIYEIYIYIKYT